jgi:hypothetical protein
MKKLLGIGTVLFVAGVFAAIFGYAPLLTPRASSMPAILIGGFCVSLGTFLVLFASAKSLDTSDRDETPLIRP